MVMRYWFGLSGSLAAIVVTENKDELLVNTILIAWFNMLQNYSEVHILGIWGFLLHFQLGDQILWTSTDYSRVGGGGVQGGLRPGKVV